jgi:predicted phosphate transport protein (TIGR00153 family)
MKEIRNILGWLGMAEERSLIADAQKHVEETYKTVAFFSEAVNAYIKGDLSAETKAIEAVREGEHQADLLRSKMVSALLESLLLPPDREDLMHFVKTLDKIADWTNGAARILGYIEHRLPDSILREISTATELIVSAITKLKDGIAATIKNDLKKALEDCEEVARKEHEADDQKKTLIEAIIHAKLDPTSLLLSYELAEYLEGVTDKIEDAADFIKVIAIKAK